MTQKTVVAVVMAALMVSGVAMAAGHGEHLGACKADRAKFCKDVKPGQGEVAKCLKSHEAELAAECKAKIAEHKEKMETRKEACKVDREKFCKDVTPGKGSVHQCLKSHKAELSADCAATFKK